MLQIQSNILVKRGRKDKNQKPIEAAKENNKNVEYSGATAMADVETSPSVATVEGVKLDVEDLPSPSSDSGWVSFSFLYFVDKALEGIGLDSRDLLGSWD